MQFITVAINDLSTIRESEYHQLAVGKHHTSIQLTTQKLQTISTLTVTGVP